MRGIFRVYHKVYKASGVYLEAYNTDGAIGDHVMWMIQNFKFLIRHRLLHQICLLLLDLPSSL